MFGKIQLVNFDGIISMPQDVTAAWHDALDEYIGVAYKPLLYMGSQTVNGVNYYFIAEQTFMTNPTIRRVVLLAIHADDNGAELIENSIHEIL